MKHVVIIIINIRKITRSDFNDNDDDNDNNNDDDGDDDSDDNDDDTLTAISKF